MSSDPWGVGLENVEAEHEYLQRNEIEAREELEAQRQRTAEVYGDRMPASSHHTIGLLIAEHEQAEATLESFEKAYGLSDG